jgi:hypothetical protein
MSCCVSLALASLLVVSPCRAPRPGEAGVVVPTPAPAFPLTVAVADLSEVCAYAHRRIGRRAADWAAALLSAKGRWELVPRAKAVEAARALGLRGPMVPVEDLQRLADRLGAPLILSGVVSKTALNDRSGTVAVELRLELTEATSGEIAASASGAGSAKADRARPLPTDALVEEALRAACAAAVAGLTAAKPIAGPVLARTGEKELLVGVGSAAGLRKGRVLLARVEGDRRVILGVGETRKIAADKATVAVVAASEQPRLDDLALVP